MVWTEQMKESQRQRILENKPWSNSTGPKSAKGKSISSQNALKHGKRNQKARALKQLISLYKCLSKNIAVEVNNEIYDSFTKLNMKPPVYNEGDPRHP